MTFSSAVNSYDTYARPVSVHKWSSLGYSRNDVTDYYDDTTHWVLGQTKRHYNVESGLVDVRNEYDANTALVLQTYAFEKLKSTMTYYADGTLQTSKDGNNNTTTFSNWYRGIPKNIQFADGTGVSATVDDNGWIRSVTDENGYVTGYGYDAMGRVSGIAYPNETNLTYNTTTITFAPSSSAAYGLPAGHWEQVTQTGNRKKIVYFDGLWRPVAEQEEDIGASSATLHWLAKRYDSDGHLVFQSYPINPYVSGWKNFTDALAGITTTYDALDRVTQVKQNSELGDLTTTTEYLPGFQIRTTNPRLYPTTTGYQVYDQPSYDQLAWSAQPENKDVAITRNYFGMPMSITQSDHGNSAISVTRSYVYNASMELCKTIEPEVGSTVMGYDAAGNLAWSAAGGAYPSTTSCNTTEAYSAGRRADRSYDARNRVTFLAFPDGKGNQSWTYTPDGLVASSIVDNDGPGQGSVGQVYTYNHRRLLAGESTSQPGYTMGIGYGYDQNGNLSTQQYPNNLTVSYSPNALGQATSVASTAGKVYASGVSYYPNGGISQFTYGNGIVHTMSQNARQLPSSSVDGGIINYGFTYDANGNPTKIADNQRGLTYDRSMTYDGLDRLTGAVSGMFGGSDNWHRFSYNALDNITSWKLAGVKDYASYIYDANNRLTNIQNSAGASVVALAYDVQGNLANKNGQAYSFDYGNRLRSAANQESYRYDSQGRRVSQTNPAGGSILSTYAMSGQLMYTNDERRNDALAYIYLSGSQVARVRQATVLPSAPILTAPATNAGGSYAVTWSTTATTDSYVLEESANGGAWMTLYNGTSTNAAVSGKAPGSYAYRVKACNTLGCSAYSATSTVQVIAPPSAAPTLTAPTLNTTGSYAVSWTTISGADNYVLEESANGGSSWAQAYSGAGASANIAGKSAGTYTYRVKACNAAGCGGYSATAQTQVMFPPSGVPALTVPGSSYNGAYTATWSSVSTADRYELEESANGGSWMQVYSANGTSMGFTGKAAGTYTYRVRACNASGCGGYSNTGQAQVVSAPATAPSLTVPANSYGGTYAITWTTVATADRYELIESVNGGGWTLAYNGSATNAGFSGRAAGTYAYQVRACNAAGCGPYSATGSLQALYAPGSAPSLSVP
ncbi:RHS repeat protein, partial [Solilutibacter silvestris]